MASNKAQSHKKQDTRSLNISNFRNIAPYATDDGANRETLKLNRSLKRNELGGLVILIGGNNCGKSNILDALEKVNDPKLIDDSDYTDWTAVRVKPTLDIDVAHGSYVRSEVDCGTTLKGTFIEVLRAILLESESLEGYKLKYYRTKLLSEEKYISIVEELMAPLFNPTVKEVETAKILNALNKRKDKDSSELQKIIETLESTPIEKLRKTKIEITRFGTPLDLPEANVGGMNVEFREKYGYELYNTVTRYRPSSIKYSDFKCSPEKPSEFIKNLLRVTGYDIESIQSLYKDNNPVLYKCEKDIQKELSKISKNFNRLFNMQDKQYDMVIRLEEMQIKFILTCGKDTPLNLDKQSEGFRWTFGFFFNLLAAKNFQPGEIILIDEFGNSLNFGTIADLGNQLRAFAKMKGITFVIATQNPMIINLDYLDEVRLVVPSSTDNSSKIINDFNKFTDEFYDSDGKSKYGKNNHDVLRPILNGMTIGRNYMRSEDRKTIFVEGITDYFYLSAFQRLIKTKDPNWKCDLEFLPINGLGSKIDDPEILMETLKRLEHYDTTLLTDSDFAGQALTVATETYKIKQIKIGDIFTEKQEIEDLFSKNDQIKLNVSEKCFDICASFAHNIEEYELEDETMSNFKKLLNALIPKE